MVAVLLAVRSEAFGTPQTVHFAMRLSAIWSIAEIQRGLDHGEPEGSPLEARVTLPVDNPLQAAIARDEVQRRSQEGAVVFPGFQILQMDRGDVALAFRGGREPAGAADVQSLDRDPFGS